MLTLELKGPSERISPVCVRRAQGLFGTNQDPERVQTVETPAYNLQLPSDSPVFSSVFVLSFCIRFLRALLLKSKLNLERFKDGLSIT